MEMLLFLMSWSEAKTLKKVNVSWESIAFYCKPRFSLIMEAVTKTHTRACGHVWVWQNFGLKCGIIKMYIILRKTLHFEFHIILVVILLDVCFSHRHVFSILMVSANNQAFKVKTHPSEVFPCWSILTPLSEVPTVVRPVMKRLGSFWSIPSVNCEMAVWACDLWVLVGDEISP